MSTEDDCGFSAYMTAVWIAPTCSCMECSNPVYDGCMFTGIFACICEPVQGRDDISCSKSVEHRQPLANWTRLIEVKCQSQMSRDAEVRWIPNSDGGNTNGTNGLTNSF